MSRFCHHCAATAFFPPTSDSPPLSPLWLTDLTDSPMCGTDWCPNSTSKKIRVLSPEKKPSKKLQNKRTILQSYLCLQAYNGGTAAQWRTQIQSRSDLTCTLKTSWEEAYQCAVKRTVCHKTWLKPSNKLTTFSVCLWCCKMLTQPNSLDFFCQLPRWMLSPEISNIQ